MSNSRPIRILHSVGSLNQGGIEAWLMHVLRHIGCKRFKMDFVVRTKAPGVYDDEAISLGAKVIPCVDPRYPWQFIPNLKKVLHEHGPYDIVHCHDFHYATGTVLRFAAQMGIPGRIAHSHNDNGWIQERPLYERIATNISNNLISKYAVEKFAASKKAASAMFGRNWQKDPLVRILRCAIDLEPFRINVNKEKVRYELGIPPNAHVIGHIGRFAEQKNHKFLVEIASATVHIDPNAFFLLIGAGPLRPLIEKQVAEAGLQNHFVFAGTRTDIPQILLGAIDVFLFPSLFEGLPVVGIEVQAAGLPCVISDTITSELDVVKPLMHRLSLVQPATVWANELVKLINKNAMKQPEALRIIGDSAFNINASVRELENVYSKYYQS